MWVKKIKRNKLNELINFFQDIALISVPAIASNIPVIPILLPKLSQADKTFIGMQSTVTGFGRTSDTAQSVSPFMEYVQLKVIANKECSSIYGRRIVTDDVICAKGIDKANNACIGGENFFFNNKAQQVEWSILIDMIYSEKK